MLEAKQVSVTIKQKKIIEDINIKVTNQQFVGLIGPNGCGKSTFLKTIYKSIKPTHGDITFQDIDILTCKEKELAKKLGVLTQFNSLPFDFTVYHMVNMGRAPHQSGFSRHHQHDDDIVMEALKKTNLLSYKDKSFLSLSGGEKQRVLLARTLAQEPEFLILDEPTNHLDIRFQIELLNLVKDLNIGTLAVLHNLEQAAQYCDYIYLLKEGHIVAQGKPIDCLTNDIISDVYDVSCERFINPVNGQLGFVFQPK